MVLQVLVGDGYFAGFRCAKEKKLMERELIRILISWWMLKVERVHLHLQVRCKLRISQKYELSSMSLRCVYILNMITSLVRALSQAKTLAGLSIINVITFAQILTV